MFKGFQNTSSQFKGFPHLNFQMNNEAYGFSGCTHWLDAGFGLDTQTDLSAITQWNDKVGASKWVQLTAGNQPRLRLADASFNNLPTIDFYSNTRRLTDSLYGIDQSNLFTIAIVAKVDTANTSSNDVLSDSGGVNSLNRITFAQIGDFS